MNGIERRIVFASLALPALIFAVGMTAPARAQWKGTVVKEGEVTVVRNPKEPLYRTPVLELAEDLSLGGPDAQGEAALDRIRQVLPDDAGTLYVLDERASHVKVFDASGKYLRTIGRKGQGPGELEYPMTMSLNEKTGELAVHQQSRGIAFFKTDGTYLRQLSLKVMLGARARLDSRGQIYLLEIVMDNESSRYATRKLAPDGSVLATISETPTPTGSGNTTRAFIPVAFYGIDREDRFIYGFPETYEIQIYGPTEAKVLRKITRAYDPVAVTDEDKAERRKDVPPGYSRELEFPKHHPAYSRFFLSDLGHIFVQTYEKADGGRLIHDVFDAEGRFIGRLPLKPSGIGILKGKYYALEEDEEGYQCVKRYAVTWLVK
ncbi:MAG TPA: 6-bladed beta-propeller [Candidatus Aminicenantes bacterium]|nr:6-bladed beta-propeller [Candidatus Aminicenantes bacterium]